MQTIDDFIDQGRQQRLADSDRLTAAAFQHIYDAGIATLAAGEPLDPEDQRRFTQACGFWGKSQKDIDADIATAQAKREAQATVARSDSIHIRAATIRAQFRAAGISPLRDSEAYRENLAAMQEESAEELQMLQAAESLLAQHEPMSTTVDGLPGEIAIHEAAHVTIGIALGCKLESVALQGRNGITIFSEGISDTIQQGAVCCAGGVAVGHFYNQPMTAHLSRQDSLNLLRLLGDHPRPVKALRRAQYLAECIVATHEGAILNIARRLESERRLSAGDLAEELAGIESWENVQA